VLLLLEVVGNELGQRQGAELRDWVFRAPVDGGVVDDVAADGQLGCQPDRCSTRGVGTSIAKPRIKLYFDGRSATPARKNSNRVPSSPLTKLPVNPYYRFRGYFRFRGGPAGTAVAGRAYGTPLQLNCVSWRRWFR
jgi:hypothetical protein